MAYTAAQHTAFAQRCEAFMRSLQNLREEAARLDLIYVNEAASGSDADFGDSGDYTEQQIINCISMFRDLESFLNNGSVSAAYRTVWMSPFLI